jgi:hypothetical protein
MFKTAYTQFTAVILVLVSRYLVNYVTAEILQYRYCDILNPK